MWGKTEKRERVLKKCPPKNEEPLPTEKAGRGSFLYLRKKQSLLAIFLYQIIRIRITQFFCFIEIAASFIRFLQLYLTTSLLCTFCFPDWQEKVVNKTVNNKINFSFFISFFPPIKKGQPLWMAGPYLN